MISIRPVLYVVGILLSTLAVFMFIPALADATAGNPDWRVFLTSAFFTLFVGITFILMNHGGSMRLNVRQTFLLTTIVWIIMAAFAALPFAFSELGLTYTDAFFESMSGLTTTGATVIVGLDGAPPGILLWRSLLQWLGGIGIIVMAIAVLPLLGVGGMQLFHTESSDQSEKALPRATQISAVIAVIYLMLTMAAAASYWAAGMTAFEAICHAMTTIATGGYSTYDASIGYFQNNSIEWVVSLFMVLSGIPFILYFEFARGNRAALWRDSQVRWYLCYILIAIIPLALWLWLVHDKPHTVALRHAVFNITSVITGTGFASTDYGSWGGFSVTFLMFVMIVGGCSGSTTGGIKIFRFQMLYAMIMVQIKRLLQPHGVFVARYNRKPIPDPVADAVMSFFFLFGLTFGLVALMLSALGLDFMTAMSGTASALANVGPGLGDIIGPAGTYAPLPDAAKWLLAVTMLLGRLEFFTVLALFTSRFWQG